MTITQRIAALTLAAAVALPAGTALTATAALAQKPTPIKQFKQWGAYSFTDKTRGKVCYILATPSAKQPADRDHGDVFFLVSQKPKGDDYESQVEVGYALKDGEDVTVQISGQTFPMFTKDNNAWLKDTGEESSLVRAMRKGATMEVKGVSKKGTRTSYTYSLSGVTAALAAIKGCPSS